MFDKVIDFSYRTEVSSHKESPPADGWHRDIDNHYLHYINGKWTGMWIWEFRYIWVIPEKREVRPGVVTFKRPYYRVKHETINGGRDIIEAPTLNKARKLAEWYYSEWLKVNNESTF